MLNIAEPTCAGETNFVDELRPPKCCDKTRCKPYKLDNLLWRHYFSSNHPGTFLPVYHHQHPWVPPEPAPPVPCSKDSLCEALKTDRLVRQRPPEISESKYVINVCLVCGDMYCGSGPDKCKTAEKYRRALISRVSYSPNQFIFTN